MFRGPALGKPPVTITLCTLLIVLTGVLSQNCDTAMINLQMLSTVQPACCGGVVCPGSTGLPDHCTTKCAEAFLPFVKKCGTAISHLTLAADTDVALARLATQCRTVRASVSGGASNVGAVGGTPHKCGAGEINLYMLQTVQRACCSDASCSSGLPASCSNHCATAFLPLVQRCGTSFSHKTLIEESDAQLRRLADQCRRTSVPRACSDDRQWKYGEVQCPRFRIGQPFHHLCLSTNALQYCPVACHGYCTEVAQYIRPDGGWETGVLSSSSGLRWMKFPAIQGRSYEIVVAVLPSGLSTKYTLQSTIIRLFTPGGTNQLDNGGRNSLGAGPWLCKASGT
eukprot:COSAG01_NODE_15440_length_1337_cov_1.473344_1_plen_339_part_10